MNQYYKFIYKSSKKNKLITIYLILKLFIFRKLSFLDKKFQKKYLTISKKTSSFKSKGRYSQDWFSYNIKYLSRIIYKYNLTEKNMNILEIGCFEGLSTVFFLTNLRNSNIHCVDPFFSFAENKDKDFNQVFENFKNNTKEFQTRVRLSKTTSDDYFKKNLNEKFDLIYIDGNHHADNVLRDARNSFKLLNKGGFIVFDDFLWGYYDEINLNPIGGVKQFLFENFFDLRVVSIGYQLVIQRK
jgi:predicted O-methyltransferase YrrM